MTARTATSPLPPPAPAWANGRVWAAFTLVALAGLAIAGIRQPFWGDEYHFVDTVRLFASRPPGALLRDYPEVTPPLVFLLYRGWAGIFGDSVISLRLASLACAAVAWNALWQVLRRLSGSGLRAWWLALVVVLNPYALGTSLFVFTDMPALMFLLCATWALLARRPWVYGALAAAALLCRQYTVVLPVAVLAAGALEWWRRGRADAAPIAASLLAFAPLLALFALWGGFAPPSGMRLWYVPNLKLFNTPAITAYVAFGTLYALPVVLAHLARRRWRVADAAVLVLGVPWYLLMKIEPSAATITQGRFHTVGLAHRAAVAVMGTGAASTVLFGVMFVLGLLVTLDLLAPLFARRGPAAVPPFVALAWPVFLLVMPFAYQVWEKYLLLVLPFLVAGLAALDGSLERAFAGAPSAPARRVPGLRPAAAPVPAAALAEAEASPAPAAVGAGDAPHRH